MGNAMRLTAQGVVMPKGSTIGVQALYDLARRSRKRRRLREAYAGLDPVERMEHVLARFEGRACPWPREE